MAEVDEARDRKLIQDALQLCLPSDHPDLETNLVTGWVVICERIDGKGDKWLSIMSNENMSKWTQKGMLHMALHDEYDREDGDE